MTKIDITKTDVARRQLAAAICMYFAFGDEISIHTLAAAARNVLANLCALKGVSSPVMLDRLLKELVKPEHHKEVRDRFREPENFFKHADRDPNGVLCFNVFRTEYVLLEAVEAYSVLTGEHVPEFHIYRSWWILHNQDCLHGAKAEFMKALNGVSYEAEQRREFFADMMR